VPQARSTAISRVWIFIELVPLTSTGVLRGMERRGSLVSQWIGR
jgi:hypothetical protein